MSLSLLQEDMRNHVATPHFAVEWLAEIGAMRETLKKLTDEMTEKLLQQEKTGYYGTVNWLGLKRVRDTLLELRGEDGPRTSSGTRLVS